MQRRITTNGLALLLGAAALMLAEVAHGADPTEERKPKDVKELSDAVNEVVATESRVASMDATGQGEAPDYDPQPRGKPRDRVKTGVRGGRALPIPLVLSPDHLADTASPVPSLFWYIDRAPPAQVKIIFTLSEDEGMEPLVEIQLAPVQRAGIQRIRLAEFGVNLDLGVEYQWSVALSPDAGGRSGDVFTTGYIRRVATPPELTSELKLASVNTYASLGLWYDALEAASDAVDAAPADLVRRSQRNALLRQAGFDGVFD